MESKDTPSNLGEPRSTEPLTFKITQKWGFGMAPIKNAVQHERERHVKELLAFLNNQQLLFIDLQSISEVKGLFNRTLRQDQWDWYTVFEQLGRPSRRTAKIIAESLFQLRMQVKNGSEAEIRETKRKVALTRTVELLEVFLTPATPRGDVIYVLSTRELPLFLKIGYTTRSVTERVDEINRATGVIFPFGVRASWRVRDDQGRVVEKKIHQVLKELRVRTDREFFCMDFLDAVKIINSVIKDYHGDV
jgi:hypothetical protein